MSVQAIIPAAGSGRRMKSGKPKLLLALKGIPVIVRTLKAFEQAKQINSVIVVTSPSLIERIKKLAQKYGLKKVCQVIKGGATRQISVEKGLQKLNQKVNVVCVHDGARPFVSSVLIDKAVKACRKISGVIVATAVKSTVKEVNQKTKRVRRTLSRDNMWEVQTPQVFKVDVLKKAHRLAKGSKATDDAMLVERLGKPIKVIQGDYRNIKITTPEDFMLAQMLVRS